MMDSYPTAATIAVKSLFGLKELFSWVYILVLTLKQMFYL